MLKKVFLGLVSAVLMTAASTALAKPAKGEYKPSKKVMIFRGTEIEGEILGPNGGWVKGYEKVVFKSLIEYRMDFIPELSRQGDEL